MPAGRGIYEEFLETTIVKMKYTALALALMLAGLTGTAAQAQDKVKIGYISDMSGLYADLEGKGGSTAIQMAIDDFGGKVLGMPIELLTVDHQNKPDIVPPPRRASGSTPRA